MITLLRANRDLRWLFIAQVISFMGDWFSFVAVTGIVKDATGSEFLVSLAYVSFSLPSFLASPIAGVTVDRFDRRRLLLIVSLLQAVAALGLLTSSGSTVWPLFVFQGVISAFAAFVKPAIDAGVPNLARDSTELRTANALFGSTWGVMLAVGAAVGGVFSEAFGRRTAFVANAVSFVIAMLLIALVRRPMQEAHHADRPAMRPIADMAEAVRYARQDHVVLALIASKSTFAIGAGTVSQLPVLATSVFGWNDGGTGMLLAARGVGAGLGPLIASRFTQGSLSRVLRICGLAGVVFSACYLVAAWSPVIYLAAVVIAIGHLGGGSQWTLSTYGLQLRTPDHIRGRVMAGDFAIVTLVMSITGLGAGVMSELVGVRWTITAFASAAAVAGFVYIAATRPLVQQLATEEAAADATTSV
ncbi:MAG: MFS transporter [Actinobacteria bacterium]|nr:MFS transporter [Acidimicrobiaceae bacterium]MBP7888946.1 MFS transporter [Ilumatobacteraceae bacterium]NMD23265.1 MFS transporter [Actinomycetota bacterium]HQY15114.1 MFS transporter [Ilumatobacteraceae bacterium]HQY86720.1 MFS transporter [Ilumatobacteraceae bacterium]